MSFSALHWLVLLFCLLSAGCKSESEGKKNQLAINQESGAKNEEGSANDKKDARSDIGLRAGYDLERSLLRTHYRSELRASGLFVDLGTPDETKYTRAGWESGWLSKKKSAGDVSSTLIAGTNARLNTYHLSSPQSIVLRARSTGGKQELSLKIGKTSLPSQPLGSKWSELQFSLTDLKVSGRSILNISHSASEPVEVDWVWFGDEVSNIPPSIVERVGKAKIEKRVRRAILAPSARSFSYYFSPPKDAQLIFDFGIEKGEAEFVVRVQSLKGEAKELFRKAGAPAWQDGKVDLSNYAGQPIRLELATEGLATGAAWGEPGIFVAERKGVETLGVEKGKAAKNLVMIVLDTTRADSFAAFSKGNAIHTPVVDAFAKISTVFTSAYNVSNWTKPSVTSMLSGLSAMTHGATKPASRVPENAKLLSEHLKEHGFDTLAYSANPVVGPAHGFDKGWDSMTVYEKREGDGHAMYTRASNWIRERETEKKRFFLYIQTIDAHTTYAPPRSYSKRYHKENYSGIIGNGFTRDEQRAINEKTMSVSERDKVWIDALYKGELSYQDEKVGFLLKALKETGRLEDTVVVLTNDHGEEIFDHGTIGHGWQLYEEMIQAPLMIHYPKVLPAKKVSHMLEHVDLPPTLLELLGLPPMQGIDGRSMLARIANDNSSDPLDYIVSTSDNGKRTVISGGWKLIVHKNKGWVHLFQLGQKDAEFKERRKDSAIAGRMLEIYLAEAMHNPSKLSRLSGQSGKKLHSVEMKLDPKTKAQLEALGYL